MNKAILVIDMPDSCDRCPVRSFIEYGKWCAGHDNLYINSYPVKPDWCPLKELPKRLEGNDSIYYQWGDYEDGWNHCIDSILSE